MEGEAALLESIRCQTEQQLPKTTDRVISHFHSHIKMFTAVNLLHLDPMSFVWNYIHY